MQDEETRTSERLQLADELANLVEALKDPATGEDMIESLEDKGELRLFAVLGKSKTIVVIKSWTKEEIEELAAKEDVEWPEYLDAKSCKED